MHILGGPTYTFVAALPNCAVPAVVLPMSMSWSSLVILLPAGYRPAPCAPELCGISHLQLFGVDRLEQSHPVPHSSTQAGSDRLLSMSGDGA